MSDAVLDGINRIFLEALTCETEESLGITCLAVAEEVTQSTIGFIGEINPQGLLDDIAISNPGWDACRMRAQPGHRKVPIGFKVHAVYGRVLLDGKGFFTNDPASHPDSIGVPEGHPPLEAFLGVPLIRGGKTIGMVAVGNREGGYRDEDLKDLEALAPAIVQAFVSRRAEVERERLLEEVRLRAAELSATITSMAEGLAVYGPNGELILLNPAFDDILGYTAEQRKLPIAERVKLMRLNTPEGKLLSIEELPPLRALRGERADGQVFVFHRQDGKIVWISVSAAPILVDGRVTGAVVTLTDITELHNLQNEIQRRAEALDLTLGSISEGLIIYGPEGEIARMNCAAERILGFSMKEWEGMDFAQRLASLQISTTEGEMITPDQAPRSRALRGETVYGHRMVVHRPDGKIVYIMSTTAPIRDSRGHIVGAVASFNDITSLIKAQQEAQRRAAQLDAANKELETFTYSVSHDLQAPLRHIDGFSRILMRDYSDKLDGQGRQYLELLRDGSQRMAQLIEDLLKLSRLTRAEMRLERVNLSEMVESIATELHQEQLERRMELVIAPGLVVNGDAHLLRIALENLLRNAWKFTFKREQARIEFGIMEQDGQRVYYVRDNGAGFDMAYADRLFAPFQRLHKQEEFPGTGIGLATVQRIIRRHGGRVWAEGEVGQGATVYFALG